MLATALAWLILAPFAIVCAVFLTEVVLGLRAAPTSRAAADTEFAILMPAHNEGAAIAATIAPLAASLPPAGRLLVVADNCSDDTAAVARSSGATVVERNDPARRGKGFALAFGREVLAGAPPGCVIVLDADCRFVGDGPAAAALAARAGARDRPVQARYVFTGDRTLPAMVQVSNFALLVKNLVRQRGLARLGAPALLGGTGMAFPWPIFAQAALATDDLVEDLALGLALAESGRGATYADDIAVASAASTAAGTLVQRTRWEHGFLDTARRHGLRLLGRAVGTGDPSLAWMALHLLTPPLALLVLLGGALLIGEAGAALVGAGSGPALVTALLLLLVAAAVAAAWRAEGRETLSPGALLRVPLYVLWKLPVYLRFATRRERDWVRSERTGAPMALPPD